MDQWRVSTKQIAKININDLLGRKSIVLDEEKIQHELKERIILVTGAAGSIGSGIVRQLAGYNPVKLIMLDQAESPLYDIHNELKMIFQMLILKLLLGY